MRKILILFTILFFPFSLFAQDTTRLSLLFVGDIMQHDSNIAAAYDGQAKKYDYTRCFEYVAPVLRSADLTIGNLELTLAGKPYKGYPQFSAPNELAYELKRAGFDVLVTANNHSVDRGRKGIEKTIDVLDTLSLLHTGTFKDSATREQTYPLVIEKKGVTISLLNYTYGTNGIPVPRKGMVNLIDTVQMKTDFEKARSQKTDVIIVFLHWGDEYQSLPNKSQKKLAEWCFREGAKMVIGAHPHVLQPMEWRKEKDQFVVYSLGNFISGQRPRYRDGGAMVWLELQKVKIDSVTSSTRISQATYELEWVQKSTVGTKDFVIMPFRYFENDTAFFANKSAQQSFDLFRKDSRALYAKHNVNVMERVFASPSDSLRYAICIGSFTDEQNTQLMEQAELKKYSLQPIAHGDNRTLWYIGEFTSVPEAEKVLSEIQSTTSFKNSRIVRWIEGTTDTKLPDRE